jgi:anti-anti-sigma regulatory factor
VLALGSSSLAWWLRRGSLALRSVGLIAHKGGNMSSAEGSVGDVSIRDDAQRRVAALEAELAEERQMRAALESELAQRAAEGEQMAEMLRSMLHGRVTPVLDVGGDILVVPVVGDFTGRRVAQLEDRIMSEVERTKSTHVIVDLSCASALDQDAGQGLVTLARAVELSGVRCVVCGLPPAVAQTLVELGVYFFGFSTQRNLRQALEACRRTSTRSFPPPSVVTAASTPIPARTASTPIPARTVGHR